MLRRITAEEWKNIPSGTPVPDGFGNYLFAPIKPGIYTLYELVSDENTHVGWTWINESKKKSSR